MHNMTVTNFVSLLFLTTVNSQLAFIVLHHQHFQCMQSAKTNYRAAIQHQYFCVSSLTLTCVKDATDYTSGSMISSRHFCGFFNGRNAMHPQTIWNIHAKTSNVHIHFLLFKLLHNYWFCDYEYLRVINSNKDSIFCGERYPWVYDVLNSSVKLLFITPRLGLRHYQLEFLYYGAYFSESTQHFVVVSKPSFVINTCFANVKQKEFETFHFISNGRLDIVQFAARNVCSVHQVVCYDGPGVKSPVLQFTHLRNQSEWQCISSTFQMWCTFSRQDAGCTKIPHIHYRAKCEQDIKVKYIEENEGGFRLDESDVKGTRKYIYRFRGIATLEIYQLIVGSPHRMLYEGYSCIYGGIYIGKTLSSQDSDILSNCVQPKTDCNEIYKLRNDFIVLIHYSGYASEKIVLDAVFSVCTTKFRSYCDRYLTFTSADFDEGTFKLTKQNFATPYDTLWLASNVFNLRKVFYISISLEIKDTLTALDVGLQDCVSCTIFYVPHLSNIRGRVYDVQMLETSTSQTIIDFIQSVVVNLSSCDMFAIPDWTVKIRHHVPDEYDFFVYNRFHHHLPTVGLAIHSSYRVDMSSIPDVMVHILKPADSPAYAIWRIWIEACWEEEIFIEVLTDKYRSSSVYRWKHFESKANVYMAIDEVVNVQIITALGNKTRERCSTAFTVWLLRHFVYDDRRHNYIAGQTPEFSNFTFHNLR